MSQFDACAHPLPALRRIYPLVVRLRSDLIPVGEETVIAPLAPRRHFAAAVGRLSPIVEIDGEEYVVLIEKLATVPARSLPRRIANLSQYRESLLAAVDLLFFGV